MLHLVLLGIALAEGQPQPAQPEQVKVFVAELRRKLSDGLEQEKELQEHRRHWCEEKLQLLDREKRFGEGVIEELRSSVKEKAKALVQVNASDADVSQAELQERLHLRGRGSSAMHRFTATLRQRCEALQRFGAEELEARAEQLDLLKNALEAFDASEALRGVDTLRLREVSFLQRQSEVNKDLPDLLSLFAPASRAGEVGQELPQEHERDVVADVAQEPKVLELMASLHKADLETRSKEASWCEEERRRQSAALSSASAEAKNLRSAAEQQRHRKASLVEQMEHLSSSLALTEEVLSELESNERVPLQKERSLAAQVFKKVASDFVASPGPAEAAVRYLQAAGQSFEREAVMPGVGSLLEQGHEVQGTLSVERRLTQRALDRSSRRLQRHEELLHLLEAQVESRQRALKSLADCAPTAAEWKAEANALQDAQLVFAGQAPRIRGRHLSRLESAAEALGVA